MTQQQVLDATRKALFEVFRSELPDNDAEAHYVIHRSTMFGVDDPGEWSPRATCIIHTEIIPLPGLYMIGNIERWSEASDKIPGHFIEHINDAVAAVYPC
jgi:hypothetical protein